MNLENNGLGERSQTQKATYSMISCLCEMSRIDKSTETESRVVVGKGWGEGVGSGC